jgi:hypothetical protein
MPSTYQKIATTTLSSGITFFKFSSIPQTYTDLVLIFSAFKNSSNTATGVWVRANDDSSSLYSSTVVRGTGTAADSFRTSNQAQIQEADLFFTNDIPGSLICHIMNYANTSTYKTFLFRKSSVGTSSGEATAYVGLWRSTSAINEIVYFFPGGNSQIAGGTATLYGIKAA